MENKSMSHGRKVVRVVAKVKPSTDPASSRSILVHKPMGEDSETVSISFGAQFAGSKDSYKLDYCYEENESNGLILTKEIKPLVSSVFEGKDANVIAHGARSSGKTFLIQGNEKELGLAVLTMVEMLSMAEQRGNSISVSIYEVSQETVYDLLDQEKRMVSVLEGAQGKIQLKGLSQVPVKSLSDFQNLYFGLKKTQKLTSHKGVMIHVTSGNANSGVLGRMNFLDMAGYEDSRKQNSGVAPLEITRINKSIYALQNVMYALNANESHVPYRESKLTRMLKGCLQGCNRTLLITCLPREFSQDSFYMLNLASQICLGSKRAMNIPTKKKINTLTSSTSLSSAAQRKQTPLVVSTTSTKQRGNVTETKTKLNAAASAMKGRKLFGEANNLVKCKNNSKKMEGKTRMTLKKKISHSKVVLSVQASSSEEEVCSSFIIADSQSSLVEEEKSTLVFSSSATAINLGYSIGAALSSEVADTTNKETHRKHEDEEKFSGATHCDDASIDKAQIVERDDNNSVVEEDITLVNEGDNLDKENNSWLANETASPPLSMRLQELSNTLKSICKTSTQLSVPEKYQAVVEEVSEHSDITAEAIVSAELRTPERTMPSNIDYSPWKTYSAHSSKLKKSAVGEYLKFLNTAGKEDLKKLKGIGEKRATSIVELREESPEPFKTLDDLKDIGLSEKQIKGLLRKEIGEIFH
ncbi:Kinesin-like protein KIN-10C [Cardamine amara subsp. amara]|uniref:Kinesin-like protein KIN-10C n=1 Tax=Cardamine amara subsp. amara TaxID=228776 RepID=A0ABD1C9N6_CARAN